LKSGEKVAKFFKKYKKFLKKRKIIKKNRVYFENFKPFLTYFKKNYQYKVILLSDRSLVRFQSGTPFLF